MRRATAADEAIQGAAQSSARTTATEVNTQIQQAQTRFSTKISNLESEGYAQLALIIFKLVQIFVTKPTAVRITGKMGEFFKDYDPYEYNGEYEAHASLDTTIKGNQVEVGLKDQAVFEALKTTPGLNPVEITRWWVQLKDPTLTDEDFNKFMLPPQEPQPSEDEVKAESDLAKAKITAYASIFKYAEPSVQAQIEGKLDLTPAPEHLGESQVRMAEQAGRTVDLMDSATDVDNNPLAGAESIINPPTPEAAVPPEGL